MDLSILRKLGGLGQRIAPFTNQAQGLGGLLYGADKVQDILGNAGFIPTRDDIKRMSRGVASQGKNYTVNGIEYDFKTGKAINPPPSIFQPPVNTPPAFAAAETAFRNTEERAYQQERSSVAQQTAQDPLVKKYQVAELTKAYNAASPEDKERIGLQIWATTNPTLAKQVRPGQVGYQTSAAMSGSQVFGKDIPGVTQATYQQASEQVGAPGGVQFPGSAQAVNMNAFGMGANAQQLGVSVPGQAPPSMIGENVFKQGFDVPSSENLTQTQLALLKRAFEGRLK
jgi:hypothetical protein